jgi:nucleotide-binding universal stress UspA family protein
MSYRTILVHVDASPESDSRVAASVSLAERFGAHLIGLAAEMMQPPVVDPMSGIAMGDWSEIQMEQIRQDLKDAETRFRAMATGVKSEWRAELDMPSATLATAASAADLVIVGSGQGGLNWNATRILAVGDLLMNAGRPVLILPPAATANDFGRILIAWKDRRESRRAIADALPLIRVAKQVTLLHVNEGGDEDRSIRDVRSFLERHEVDFDVRIRDGKPAEAEVADEASRVGAELIVAGAYGHTRFREWAFGGVTRGLLTDSPVARLLSH